MDWKIIPIILKYLFIVIGIIYIIVSPLISSVIQCASGDGCKNVLRDTGGLLFDSQQNIKEDIMTITNQELDDRRLINFYRGDIITNLGIWIMWIIAFVLIARAIFGANASHLFAITLVAIPFAIAMVGLFALIWHLSITGELINPYEGIWLLIKNPDVLIKIGSDFVINSANSTIL